MIVDPTAHIPEIAELHGWEYEVEEDGQTNVNIPGNWNTYTVSFLWNEYEDMLIMRAAIPCVAIPDIFLSEASYLLNLINSTIIFGSFYHQDGNEGIDHIIWRYDLVAQIEHASRERMEKVLTHICAIFDTYYPAIIHFLTQKVIVTPEADGKLVYTDLTVTAEDALQYIAHGDAPKGRA